MWRRYMICPNQYSWWKAEPRHEYICLISNTFLIRKTAWGKHLPYWGLQWQGSNSGPDTRFFSCFISWATPNGAQDLFLALCSSLLAVLRGLYVVPGTEPGSAVCKAGVSLSVLSLWPLLSYSDPAMYYLWVILKLLL